MPLHIQQNNPDSELDEVFGSSYGSMIAPTAEFPDGEARHDAIYQLVHDELFLDGNARQNLATFCQTWENEDLHKLMALSINKNMVDKDEYPQTAEIESRCVKMLADLWNSQPHENPIGTSTIGSSEACMLGGMAALHRWRARRKAEGQPTDQPNLVCGPVQVCWHKFCRYWDVEIREVPMDRGRYFMDATEMLKRVDENTICVVPTFGVTHSGNYEFVEPLADALDDLQARTGLDVDIHVDGASGAFLAPFCAPDIKFDFRVPRVKSISTSGHKFGLAPLGTGWIIWRDTSALPEELIFKVNYLGGEMPTFAINFSRPAGQIICQYFLFLRLGKEGYRKIHQTCYDTAQWIGQEVVKAGPFELICNGDPRQSIPAVTWKIKDGVELPYTLFDLGDRMRQRGWQVPAYTLPANVSDVAVQRVLVRQGFSRDMAALMIQDFRQAIAHFDKHPVSVPLTEQEAGGYKHA
ncbi:glutamate decarboxylase [Nodosilinea sp. P-1105]|uniref:glutamate decarboxylase n=1 Tax=Nodosilinea sp. P-1105 TaxID=2546229 RepID=UPI00146A7E7A|nr:glutamate decarboxylase [Nodosilinea sp. P-1105]NMF85211.1 glutamate decarboxylase [Nodosilinea sp. P-1105]